MKRKAVMAILLAALVFGTAIPADVIGVSAADVEDDWDDEDDYDDDEDDWDDEDDDVLEEGDGFTAPNGYEYEVISINDDKGTGTAMLCGAESDRITSLKVPARVKEEEYGYTFTVTEIEEEAFEDYSHLKTVTISDTVTAIGEGAFKECGMLKSVTIGKKVSKIEEKAFFKAKRLSSVKINSTVLKKMGSKSFAGIDKRCRFKVPASKLKAYKRLLKKAGAGKNAVAAK